MRKAIGAYIALLEGVDLLVFTGGIGEHSSHIRPTASGGLESLGLSPEKIQVIVPPRKSGRLRGIAVRCCNPCLIPYNLRAKLLSKYFHW